jgi:hypothetical protein
MEKLSFGPALGTVFQVSFVVDDIERAMQHWTQTLGVGPFFYLAHFPLLDGRYRGKPISPDVDVALTFSGGMCIELIHQNDRSPSPFLDFPTNGGAALHHAALSTRRFDADLEQHLESGKTLLASAAVGLGGRMAYLETAEQRSPLLELIEFTPPVEDLFGMMHATTQSWDGRDPVRRVGP